MKRYIAAAVLLTIIGLGFRLFIALQWPSDEPDDGRLYARIAINILEHRSYSIETEEPYPPTFIRVPGYPLLLAGIYSLFGHENNRAVRVVQAVLDTITCWLIALLALAWAPHKTYRFRRRLLLIALALAVFCPFPAIYVGTILTETCTILLATACALTGTLAIKTTNRARSIGWFALAGVTGGLATLVRPDSGLFVAAVGFTVVLVGLVRVYRTMIGRRVERPISDALSGSPRQILMRTILGGAVLTAGFALALTPWTIRNARVFGVFQPISPSQANMPGEFVPNGYIGWLRTWVDDAKYTESVEFPLDQEQIHIEDMPDFAFDSAAERERVAELLERYNHPDNSVAQPPAAPVPEAKPPEPSSDSQKQSDVTASSDSDEDPAEEADSPDDEADTPDEPEPRPPVEMTPEVDAGFAELTRERIARNPIRYYLGVPLKRAASMWFDTHSQYYPFQGELLPLSALDPDLHQQYWLPSFAVLTLLYTGLGAAGAWLMWRDKRSRRWLLLLALLIIPRLAVLARMENPEPRYVVEFFAFVVAMAAIAMSSAYDLVHSKIRSRSAHDAD
ncbi:MAG TPA: glycosyltransferase family 39 protein [Blastocatellia bacterium]|nr:glycosyltransferase family 39 protein [Blastocatellia bacterium]